MPNATRQGRHLNLPSPPPARPRRRRRAGAAAAIVAIVAATVAALTVFAPRAPRPRRRVPAPLARRHLPATTLSATTLPVPASPAPASPYVTAVADGAAAQVEQWASVAWCGPIMAGRPSAGADWSAHLPPGVSPVSFRPVPATGQLAAVLAGRPGRLDFSDARALVPSGPARYVLHGIFCAAHVGYPAIAFAPRARPRAGARPPLPTAPARLIDRLDFPVEIETAFTLTTKRHTIGYHLVFATTAGATRVADSYNLAAWDAGGTGRAWVRSSAAPPSRPAFVPDGTSFAHGPATVPPGSLRVVWRA